MSQQTLAIASTIKSQIAPRELMAIGATKYIALAPSEKYSGGLQFDASLFGSKKCKVLIMLNGADTYDICIFTGRNLKCVGSAKCVYAEDLTFEVVSLVEKRFAA